MTEQQKILIYYGVFFTSFLLAFIPVNAVFVFALMICVCMLAGIYMERAKVDADTFIHNHMTFMIRSFWRANLYLLGTVILGALYLILMADYETFGACVNVIGSVLNNGDIGRIPNLALACEQKFLEENSGHLLVSAVLSFAPIVFYILYRCAFGVLHAKNGDNVAEEKL